MSIGLVFWVLMILWFFGFLGIVWGGQNQPWAPHASSFLLFVLLFLIGWHDFGFVIHS